MTSFNGPAVCHGASTLLIHLTHIVYGRVHFNAVAANVAINHLSGTPQNRTEPKRLDWRSTLDRIGGYLLAAFGPYLEWALSAERINNLKLLTITANQLVYK